MQVLLKKTAEPFNSIEQNWPRLSSPHAHQNSMPGDLVAAAKGDLTSVNKFLSSFLSERRSLKVKQTQKAKKNIQDPFSNSLGNKSDSEEPFYMPPSGTQHHYS
eukprot:GDKJ01030741.1.p2 GENE.GDKJ01030741.1~~GDKJ01030741.1.p2  ORF type:complete len:104 (-),score=15.16 GDKJ01030741.1:672-983(-)